VTLTPQWAAAAETVTAEQLSQGQTAVVVRITELLRFGTAEVEEWVLL
jgi:hypothetical protein